MSRRVEFVRIGRNHNVPPLNVADGCNPGELVDAVYRYAGKFLASRSYDVTFDDGTNQGYIDGGRFGTFTVTGGA